MAVTSKGVVLAVLVMAILVTIPAFAFAAGYNDPLQYTDTGLYPQGPHGGYTTSTNKCKECHAVHLATGSYRLTRADTASEACDFCHGATSTVNAPKISLNSNGHGLSTAQQASTAVKAPADNIPGYSIQPAMWGCDGCHSVHDALTVKLADEPTTKLLKADPNPGKTYLYYDPSLVDTATKETTQTLTHWCSSCHNANFGSHKDAKQAMVNDTTTTVYGHDVSATGITTDPVTGFALNVDPDNSQNNGPKCKQCHVAAGGNFPHSGSAPSMLMTGTDLVTNPNLDQVCITCHDTGALP